MIALVSNMFYSWLQCVSLTYTLQTLMADWVSPKRWPSLACPSCSNAYSNQLHKQRQAYLHDPGMLPGTAGQCILVNVYPWFNLSRATLLVIPTQQTLSLRRGQLNAVMSHLWHSIWDSSSILQCSLLLLRLQGSLQGRCALLHDRLLLHCLLCL